ncbi:hypothetical protein B0H16DRAFT_1747590 [Mycena metata]|uniref:Uncharacterized protein n=1 Tax=Mycena metata TaxID=1033252 RepID=A0AAD7GT06_9AGAR|nr:hypothetical protein B0H16DRAFT_1747590 [Mycena metata]
MCFTPPPTTSQYLPGDGAVREPTHPASTARDRAWRMRRGPVRPALLVQRIFMRSLLLALLLQPVLPIISHIFECFIAQFSITVPLYLLKLGAPHPIVSSLTYPEFGSKICQIAPTAVEFDSPQLLPLFDDFEPPARLQHALSSSKDHQDPLLVSAANTRGKYLHPCTLKAQAAHRLVAGLVALSTALSLRAREVDMAICPTFFCVLALAIEFSLECCVESIIKTSHAARLQLPRSLAGDLHYQAGSFADTRQTPACILAAKISCPVHGNLNHAQARNGRGMHGQM